MSESMELTVSDPRQRPNQGHTLLLVPNVHVLRVCQVQRCSAHGSHMAWGRLGGNGKGGLRDISGQL